MPPANLKERIAALEQRNAANRPTSPTIGGAPSVGTGAPNAAGFKDKIAKFEKKGGVPVPRGRFGLGAPPTAEGPRKQGELYGNRIPAPVRHVSAGTNGAAAGDASAAQPIPDRRSFSLSHFNADFDDTIPVSRSPTPSFQSALSGDDGKLSSESAPVTPSTSPPNDIAIPKHLLRGTSFQRAMELARITESAKVKSAEQTASRPGAESRHEASASSKEAADSGQNTPLILVSSEDTPSFVIHSSPVLVPKTPSFIGDIYSDPETPTATSASTESTDTNIVAVDSLVSNISPASSSPIDTDMVPSLSQAAQGSPQITPRENASIQSPPTQLPTLPSNDDFGSINSQTSLKKAPLTLETKLEMDTLMSPLLSGNLSATATALDSPLSDSSKPESAVDHSSGKITPPPLLTPSPLSPMAKLAYDDSELSINIQDQTENVESPPSTPGDMNDMNSTCVSQATRVTPTTGRGVPLFLPSNMPHQARKSDFVFFPPTPEATTSEFSVNTAPTIQVTKPAFTTVVHTKVRETAPAPSEKLRVPVTPQTQRIKHTNTSQPPPSPGQGELAALWHEAALLEYSLEQGELPAETITQTAENDEKKKHEAKEAEVKAKALQAQSKAAAVANQKKRSQTTDETTSTKLKHSFLVPLSRAKTSHRKEASASATVESFSKPQAPVAARPKSSIIPDNVQVSQRPVTPDNNTHLSPHSTPSKSPKQRFGSLRKLGSIAMARPSTMYSTRHSQSGSSEMSAEDSPTVTTPTDHGNELDHTRSSMASEFGQLSINGSTTSFNPSLSSKKSSGSMSRATSFAGKMWSRARTRSNGSGLSVGNDADDVPRLPASVPDLPQIQLPYLPHVPASAPSQRHKNDQVVNPPRRSASLKHPMNLPPTPSEFLPQLPPMSSSAFFSTNSGDVSGDSLMLPDFSDSSHRSSWASYASTSASSMQHSPLFDESFINSFPSVPETTTPTFFESSRTKHSLGRSASVLTTVKERPSIDVALVDDYKLQTASRAATPTPR